MPRNNLTLRVELPPHCRRPGNPLSHPPLLPLKSESSTRPHASPSVSLLLLAEVGPTPDRSGRSIRPIRAFLRLDQYALERRSLSSLTTPQLSSAARSSDHPPVAWEGLLLDSLSAMESGVADLRARGAVHPEHFGLLRARGGREGEGESHQCHPREEREGGEGEERETEREGGGKEREREKETS
eukprot:scaffold36392_cov30-Tisochrysis_lutea.AAC.7